MCRFLAVIGSPSLKRQAMEAFFPLAATGKVKPWEDPGHLDGWGVASYDGRHPYMIARSAGDVRRESTAYLQSIDRAQMHNHPFLLVHFRKATFGNICVENVHPFIEGPWLYAHNGSVQGLDKLGPRPTMAGTTDSEEFLHRWCAAQQPIASFEAWAEHVIAICPFSSLTSLISDGSQLLAYRRANDVPLPPFREAHDPRVVHADYYGLFHLTSDDGGQVICSEQMDKLSGAWRPLANGESLLIPFATT